MAFEVGKKYKRLRSDRIYNCLFAHRVAGGSWGTFDLDNDYIPRTHQWGADWSEYKEPRSVTRWINVWEDPTGKVQYSTGHHKTKEAALNNAAAQHDLGGWILLDTIEVKWEEKL